MWSPGALMRVLALMKYGASAASTRQRLLQYQPYLAAQAVTIELSPLLDDAHVAGISEGRRSGLIVIARAYAKRLRALVRARGFDVIWVHCELLPYMPGWVERLVRLAGRPVVLDYDDAIFHMYDAHKSSLVRGTIGQKFGSVVRSADVVLAGNRYLADFAARFNDAVTVVPTVVDTDVYRPRGRGSAEPGPLTFGWIGSPSTWPYVVPLLPAILDTAARLGARFRAVGAGPAARGVDGVDAIDWAEAREVADIQAMDIGIMPLPDEPWARGKCGYKLIQYMACGLPTVASPVGVNREIVNHGVDGYLATSEAEWVAALEALASDVAMRRAMGARGRAKVVERYSLASQQPVVLQALRDACDRR